MFMVMVEILSTYTLNTSLYTYNAQSQEHGWVESMVRTK